MNNKAKLSISFLLILLYCMSPDAGWSMQDFHLDTRYHHDRFYPQIGQHVDMLPQRNHTINYRNHSYHYYGGIWYGPGDHGFVVMAPPIGAFVPVLPPAYTTIWFKGIPYYYANNTYYVWQPDRNCYIVAEPPQPIINDSESLPVMANELFVYPTKGQDEQQQADDRYSCHSWAVQQTTYDPTKPPDNVPVNTLNTKRENYQRALKACLEGKGYSVR